MDDIKYSLGIDIGGTNTVFGLIDDNGQVIKKTSIYTKSNEHPKFLFQRIFNEIDKWENMLKSKNIIKFIGAGVPNGNYFTGYVVNPPNLGKDWLHFDLCALIRSFRDIPVAITNDANAAAIGEKFYGAAKKFTDAIIITLGTGLGSGLIVNNKIIYGNNGFAGELGHLVVDRNGRECNCGLRGCLEMYVSAKGLEYTIKELKNDYPENKFLHSLNDKKKNGKRIDEAFDNNEKLAIDIYKFTGRKLGQGLAMASTILAPEAFIFYGGLSNARHRILNYAEKSMNDHLPSYFKKNDIKILHSNLFDGEAGIIGASCLNKTQN